MSDCLPKNWSIVAIGKLCELVNGKAFKPTDWSEKGLPIIRIQNLNNADAPYNHYNGKLADKFLVKHNDLLFAWSGTPGTSFGAHVWKGRNAALNQHIFKVVFDEEMINRSFLKYAINQKLNDLINNAQGGVGLRHITKKKFELTPIILPPLNEQTRIANKLEKLLTKLDRCKTRLDNVPEIIKQFRQSVLAAATSGKLTEDWRKNNKSKKWTDIILSDVIKDKPRNGFSPKAVNYETSIKSLTLTATTSGKFDRSHFKFLDHDIPKNSHLWLEEGDILIQRGNTHEYVGVSAIYTGLKQTYIYPDLMMKIRANDLIYTKYLHYTLLSNVVRSYFRNNATGTAGNMPKINQKVVMNAPILLPPKEEQKEIVRRVESLFALADQAQVKLKKAQQQVNNLSQSILAKAFRGELVPQDPNDEPAEKLLARIKQQREAEKVKQKPIKRKAKK